MMIACVEYVHVLFLHDYNYMFIQCMCMLDKIFPLKHRNFKHFSFFTYNNVCKLYKVHARQNILIQI